MTAETLDSNKLPNCKTNDKRKLSWCGNYCNNLYGLYFNESHYGEVKKDIRCNISDS